MKTKKIEVSQIMKNIIDLGGEIMSNYSTESLDLEEVTPEMAKNFHVLVPLSNNGIDQAGCDMVSIEKIDLQNTYNTSISCGKVHYVNVHPELLKNLLLLKLYSENIGMVYTSN